MNQINPIENPSAEIPDIIDLRIAKAAKTDAPQSSHDYLYSHGAEALRSGKREEGIRLLTKARKIAEAILLSDEL